MSFFLTHQSGNVFYIFIGNVSDYANDEKAYVYLRHNVRNVLLDMCTEQKFIPVSILYKSTVGRYRSVSYPDGPITARYRFIKNAYWDISMRIRAVWSEHSLGAFWITKDAKFHADK